MRVAELPGVQRLLDIRDHPGARSALEHGRSPGEPGPAGLHPIQAP